MGQPAPSLLKSALIGGAVAGFVATVPLLGDILYCMCCLPVVAGGFLAAFLYSRDCARAGARFDAGRGALVGLVSGLFYAVVHAIGEALSRLVMPGGAEEEFEQAREMLEGKEIPPETLEMVESFMELFASWVGMLLVFGLFLLLGAIFATIGGLIGGAVFKVEERPEPPIAPASTAM